MDVPLADRLAELDESARLATIEWHDSGAYLVQRSTVELPKAPNAISIMGCDAANGAYYELYSDDRDVYRVYQMSIGDGEWKLWREGEPFPQRFTARFEDDGNTIVGTARCLRASHMSIGLRDHGSASRKAYGGRGAVLHALSPASRAERAEHPWPQIWSRRNSS